MENCLSGWAKQAKYVGVHHYWSVHLGWLAARKRGRVEPCVSS
jgi:hypothetical protein